MTGEEGEKEQALSGIKSEMTQWLWPLEGSGPMVSYLFLVSFTSFDGIYQYFLTELLL